MRSMPLQVGVLVVLLGGCGGGDARPGEASLGPAEIDSIRRELIDRGERDQHYRGLDYREIDDTTRQRLFAEASAVDSGNTAWLKELVAEIGWPDSTRFGAEAARAAFLIVQHADRDPAFQASMLPIVTEAAVRGEIDRKELAYLTDRVRVKEGRPQLYGTQYLLDTAPDGSVIANEMGRLNYLLPVVEGVDGLDERRREVGLGPWREYEERMARLHERPPAERPRAVGEAP